MWQLCRRLAARPGGAPPAEQPDLSASNPLNVGRCLALGAILLPPDAIGQVLRTAKRDVIDLGPDPLVKLAGERQALRSGDAAGER